MIAKRKENKDWTYFINMSLPTHINTENLDKYFYLNNSNQIIEETSGLYTETVPYSPIAVNEVSMSHNLRKIRHYSSFFSLLAKYEKIETVQKPQLYQFFYSDLESEDIFTCIRQVKCMKRLLSLLFDSLCHLLKGLHLLEQKKICFFQILPQNIVFLSEYREKPVLRNFRYSINISKLSAEYITPFLEQITNFACLPLEIHFLQYMIEKGGDGLISEAFICSFTAKYVESQSFLSMFSLLYKEKYQNECSKFLQRYVNLHQSDIILDILEKNKKWDVYGISILFFHIFGCMNRIFSLKGTFISKITMELVQNLHPDPQKRRSLEDTLETFQTLLEEEKSWVFVQHMDNNLLPIFFDTLSRILQ